MTIRPMSAKTFRDLTEAQLLELFPGKLFQISPSEIEYINQHKDGTFGYSYLGLMLYTNGHNQLSKSTEHPKGLLYRDENGTFGVGVFFKKEAPSIPNIHIVAPRGRNWVRTVNDFVDAVSKKNPDVIFYIRHLTHEKQKKLAPTTNLDRILERHNFQSRWAAIEANPWLENAPQEDETFQHSRVDLHEVIGTPEEGMFNNIQNLSQNSKDMRKRNYRAFTKFLQKNQLTFELQPYTNDMQEMARQVVQNHFANLDDRQKAVGSTAADYENIITADPEKLHNADTHFYVGMLKNKNGCSVPIAFYALEKIGPDTVAGYATITNYSQHSVQPIMGENPDFTGFTSIKSYVEGQVMYEMKEKGYRHMELGGSETRDLDRGKQRFGAQNVDTYWLVNQPPCNGKHLAIG